MKLIDDLLNQITMYRLVLYVLLVWIFAATIFGGFGLLPYSPYRIIVSTIFVVCVGWVTNTIFCKIKKVAPNFESVYISSLILVLVVNPPKSVLDFIFLALAATLTMASKFIFVYQHKHIFNPVAIALVIMTWGGKLSPTWWVSAAPLMPLVVGGGLLIIRKLQRTTLFISFALTSFMISLLTQNRIFIISPWFFLASVMLTEPATTPPGKLRQALYGTLVGLLFSRISPELALTLGNLFSFLASPTYKLQLRLKQKTQLAPDIYDFAFARPTNFRFTAGQYMEWTLDQFWPDSRGNRRYLTLASSPTEDTIHIGVKFHPQSSSFKRQLLKLTPSQQIVAAQLSGEFTLPKDSQVKCVLVAGGIGVTPFRSMVKYLLDNKQSRELILIYSAKTQPELVYRDIFETARKKGWLKPVYVITDTNQVPPDWMGRVGRVDKQLIIDVVPNFKDWVYFLSGPRSMVAGFEDTLKQMGVSKRHIKTDFFPGYA